ncbi:hypothetical protein SDC9_153982 [bioreactor metagenome]|uniref:Uncharacterized protein n=1 Tax=bioreactor metagenome TaxID=1076179 RepID=A0A645EZ74_9ZZZZ
MSAGTAVFHYGSYVIAAEKRHFLEINAVTAVLRFLLSARTPNAGPVSPL